MMTKDRLQQVLITARADFAERCRMNGGTPATRGPIDDVLRLMAVSAQTATK